MLETIISPVFYVQHFEGYKAVGSVAIFQFSALNGASCCGQKPGPSISVFSHFVAHDFLLGFIENPDCRNMNGFS